MALITMIGAEGDCDITEAEPVSTYPPGGWNADNGVWGTDMDQETSVVIVGANSINYKSTVTATVDVLSDYKPVNTGDPYLIRALLRADNVTAKNMFLFVAWYTSAKVIVGAADILLDAPLPAINTWYDMRYIREAPATAAFARVGVGRNRASFNGYSAYAGISPQPVGFSAYLNANGVIASGSAAVYVIDTEFFDHGSNYDTATGLFTAPADGVYSFTAEGTINSIDAGDRYRIAFDRNGGARYAFGQMSRSHANATSVSAAHTTVMLLSRGDTVGSIHNHDQGANQTLLGAAGASYYTTFSGFRVE